MDDAFIKALYLSTSQEKALLLRRDPALFRPFAFRHLKVQEAQEKRLHVGRTVTCFSG